MQYNELKLTANKLKIRAGRGIAAGRGKTAGRGTKGQHARGDSKIRVGFEGGQNPLMRTIPKLPGFRSLRDKPTTIYTGQMDAIESSVIDNFVLAECGLLKHPFYPARLVLKGEIKTAKTIALQGASATAVAAIVKAKGKFTKVGVPMRQSTKKAD
jgi:large subunit ribosomal protein L15